jgi:hypothetical protein
MIKLVGAIVLADMLGLSGCAAVDSPGSPFMQDALTVSQLNASRDTFVGQVVGVRGKLAVEERLSADAGPCNVATGTGCNPVAQALLHLVDPDSPQSAAGRLDLYRQMPDGAYVPADCKILGPGSYDCGSLTPGSVLVVVGTFTKYPEPIQQVIYPDGRAVVVHSRDIYFLTVP